MQTFKSYLKEEQELLTEADTSKAINMEMAICVAYNIKKGETKAEAAKTAGVDAEDKVKKWGPLLPTAKKIAADADNWGEYLTHSGTDTSEKSASAWPGTDSTSKSDIRGDAKHNISLKKSGAPIMSAMGGGEAVGVFDFALRHYDKIPANKLETYYKAFKILREDMQSSIVRDSVVRAGAGKIDFVDWYSTKSSRAVKLARNRIKFPNMIIDKRTKKSKAGESKDLATHLKAELQIAGNIPKRPSRNTHLKLHPEITPITKDEIAIYSKEYADTDDGGWAVGSGNKKMNDIRISAAHLKKINDDPVKAVADLAGDISSNKLMKNQIQNVVDTAVAAEEWKKDLTEAFEGDDTLRSWIMYEAGSGYGKFEGKGKTDHAFTKYSPGKYSIANYMVVFTDQGIQSQSHMYKYAEENHSKVGKLDISYKSAGMLSYIKWGIMSSYEHELPMIQEELTRLQAHYMLNEGIFKDMFTSAKDKLKALANKVKDVLKMFWEKVIMGFINGIKDLFNEGLEKFAEALGITGTFTLGNA